MTLAVTRSLVYRTSDGSAFFVGTNGNDGVDSIVSVQWRGVDLCADCFVEQIDESERDDLLALLVDRS